MADGKAPGTGGTAGGDGDEAVWRDLVARITAPEPTGEDVPWPDQEDLAGPVHVTPPLPPSGSPPDSPPAVPEALTREPPTNPTGLPGLPSLGGPPTMPDQPFPDTLWPAPVPRPGPRDVPRIEDPADEHFVPPLPPPLPRLDPVTKLAWLALFGGPIYLLISTAVGAAISGLAAFLSVAAFVGGFVVLVLRMDNGRPPDSGSGDDGAVV